MQHGLNFLAIFESRLLIKPNQIQLDTNQRMRSDELLCLTLGGLGDFHGVIQVLPSLLTATSCQPTSINLQNQSYLTHQMIIKLNFFKAQFNTL